MHERAGDTRGLVALAWGLCAVYVVLVAVATTLSRSGGGDLDTMIAGVAAGYAVVGALVCSRDPGNTVGWLLLAIAIGFASTVLVDAYLADPGRPGYVAMSWLSSWVWYPWLYAAALVLPLVFPDGRLPSARWRPVLWLGVTALSLSLLTDMLRPGVMDTSAPDRVVNPLGVGPVDLWAALGVVANVVWGVHFLLGIAALVVRLRRVRGRERLQVQWFAATGAVALAAISVALLTLLLAPALGERHWLEVLSSVSWVGALLTLLIGLPLTIGTAILRHSLYDIELVVKRTLVYAALTATLAATYLLCVLTFRVVLEPLTGQSQLRIAISTLVVAALFRPARTRIQAVVDRRFFRARYDAEQTVAAFSGRLRDELDLDALGHDLQGVARTTVQPEHVSLWLREPAGSAS